MLNLFVSLNQFVVAYFFKSYPWSSQRAATQEWHSNVSMSGGITKDKTGITSWGGLGDI